MLRYPLSLLIALVLAAGTACGQISPIGSLPAPGTPPTPGPGSTPTPAPGGSTYFVTTSGNDANTCTQANPCRQIRRALTLVRSGDVINVADGSYMGFTVQSLNGASGRPITIVAPGRNAVATPTTDRSDNRDNILISQSSFIVIDGLRSSNGPRAGLRVDRSNSVTVRNGVFGNNATWGMFTNHSDDLLLEANEAHGSVGEHGIYVSNSGDRPVVRGNLVRDNAAAGIHMNADLSQGGDGLITGAVVENNVVYNNGRTGGAAINMDGVQNSVVRNNILYNRNAARGGLSFNTATDVTNTDSSHNIFGGAAFITPDDGATRHTLAQWQAMGHEGNSLDASDLNALFVNPGVDYHLRAGSPAIDRGLRLTDVTTDFEGHTRPRGASSDIGADEF
ncbi:MAG: NosD domain-containing protein [Armatimonadota bacterium]